MSESARLESPFAGVTTFRNAREVFSRSAALRRLYRLRRMNPELANELDALAAELTELIDDLAAHSR